MTPEFELFLANIKYLGTLIVSLCHLFSIGFRIRNKSEDIVKVMYL